MSLPISRLLPLRRDVQTVPESTHGFQQQTFIGIRQMRLIKVSE